MGRDDKACPACGRFFSSVLCPRCGFSGAPSGFASGCPVCGYSEPPRSGAPSAGGPGRSAMRERPIRPLPLWIWLAALAALVLAVAALAGTLA